MELKMFTYFYPLYQEKIDLVFCVDWVQYLNIVNILLFFGGARRIFCRSGTA